jgi:hypothetical protein
MNANGTQPLEHAIPGAAPRPSVRGQPIQGLKYFQLVKGLLDGLHTHRDCPNRKLHYDQLAALVLLHFFNPVLTSLRAVQQASELRDVQRKLNVGRTSLGSLSEAAGDFDPGLLRSVARELAGEVQAQDAHPRPGVLPDDLEVVAMDGSLLEALPRMAWALWLNPEQRAAKLHLEFDVLRAVPRDATLTDANANERHVLRQALTSRRLYLLDRGYAEYRLLEDIRQAGSSFVARLAENAVYEVLEERPLTDADRRAGVTLDRVVRLGCEATQADLSGPVRVIQVHVKPPLWRGLKPRARRVSSKKTFRHTPQEHDMWLVTDRMDLPADGIALLYRYRWTIELFFRWLKCTLRFKHVIFESRRGVEILVYCALIASLLITLWTGRKPTKRTLEMIQLHFQGWARLDELEAHIERLKKVTN